MGEATQRQLRRSAFLNSRSGGWRWVGVQVEPCSFPRRPWKVTGDYDYDRGFFISRHRTLDEANTAAMDIWVGLVADHSGEELRQATVATDAAQRRLWDLERTSDLELSP